MPRKKTSPKQVNLGANLAYSAPVIREKIDLYSGDAQSLLPHFQKANAALYKLGVILPRRTTEEKAAELKQAVYGEILQPLEEQLQAEYARVNLLYQECDQKPVATATKPLLNAVVDLAHPQSHRLLALLVGFDQMHRKLADLWFARQIGHKAYLETITNCRNTLKEAMKRINRLVYQTLETARTRKNKEASAETSSGTEDSFRRH